MTLPDCMMPDGADPCKGFTELNERMRETAAFLDVLAGLMEGIDDWTVADAADCRAMAKKLRGEI